MERCVQSERQLKALEKYLLTKTHYRPSAGLAWELPAGAKPAVVMSHEQGAPVVYRNMHAILAREVKTLKQATRLFTRTVEEVAATLIDVAQPECDTLSLTESLSSEDGRVLSRELEELLADNPAKETSDEDMRILEALAVAEEKTLFEEDCEEDPQAELGEEELQQMLDGQEQNSLSPEDMDLLAELNTSLNPDLNQEKTSDDVRRQEIREHEEESSSDLDEELTKILDAAMAEQSSEASGVLLTQEEIRLMLDDPGLTDIHDFLRSLLESQPEIASDTDTVLDEEAARLSLGAGDLEQIRAAVDQRDSDFQDLEAAVSQLHDGLERQIQAISDVLTIDSVSDDEEGYESIGDNDTENAVGQSSSLPLKRRVVTEAAVSRSLLASVLDKSSSLRSVESQAAELLQEAEKQADSRSNLAEVLHELASQPVLQESSETLRALARMAETGQLPETMDELESMLDYQEAELAEKTKPVKSRKARKHKKQGNNRRPPTLTS